MDRAPIVGTGLPAVLTIENLVIEFDTPHGPFRAVDRVSLAVAPGRTTALVGESGSGKSVCALSILGLLPRPPARFLGGTISFEGRDLLALPEADLRQVRGNRIAMIFQEPMTSLNPVFSVGEQVIEVLRLHRGLSRGQARKSALDLLEQVKIPDAQRKIDAYPHQLSGGMQQRVMIAMALAGDPAVLIADEPTTALDVTIQAQILKLLRELQDDTGVGILLITHDFGVVAELADEVLVMHAGRIIERGTTTAIFEHPRQPQTRLLLATAAALSRQESP